MNWLIDLLGHVSIDWLTDWLMGGLIDGFIDFRSINRTINRPNFKPRHPSINQSIHLPINKSITYSINQSIHRYINQKINQSINQSTELQARTLINQSIDRSVGRRNTSVVIPSIQHPLPFTGPNEMTSTKHEAREPPSKTLPQSPPKTPVNFSSNHRATPSWRHFRWWRALTKVQKRDGSTVRTNADPPPSHETGWTQQRDLAGKKVQINSTRRETTMYAGLDGRWLPPPPTFHPFHHPHEPTINQRFSILIDALHSISICAVSRDFMDRGGMKGIRKDIRHAASTRDLEWKLYLPWSSSPADPQRRHFCKGRPHDYYGTHQQR